MNEELDSQLSAMFDDELPQGECELLARRLSRDAALQSRWGRYAAIGAAVRGDARLGCEVAYKVSAVIMAETVPARAPRAHLRGSGVGVGTRPLAPWCAAMCAWAQASLTRCMR